MRAYGKDIELQTRLEKRSGVLIDLDDARALRRAELTLQRWAEGECGDANGCCIERDEQTGKTYRVNYNLDKPIKTKINDRETSALGRVKVICERYGLSYYHQTDPRGCALWIDSEPLNDMDYTKGVACGV